MDKIYSRKRIKIPHPKIFIHNKRLKKLYYFFVIWLVAIITVFSVIKFITPPFEKLCIEETRKLGTFVINDISTKVLKDVDYNDLIITSKDSNDNITMVKSNVILINILASDIAYKIQEKLSSLDKEELPIPIGILTGMKIFSGSGPNIYIKVMPVGSVLTNFKSDFISAGINQTIHRLYLEVKCEVSILTAYGSTETNIVNQVLFAENIIVGQIPDSYYNLEGLGQDDIMEVIN